MGYEINISVKSLRAQYIKFLRAGCTPPEATNLCAAMFGLHAIDGGWKLKEIERLLFERYRANTRP